MLLTYSSEIQINENILKTNKQLLLKVKKGTGKVDARHFAFFYMI